MAKSPQRPTSISVIGWTFIVISVLMMLSGGMGLLSHTLITQQSGGNFPVIPDNAPTPFKFTTFMFQYFQYLAILQFFLAIFILMAAIQFLKLRSWARTALEVVTWLGLIYTIGFGIFWIFSFTSIASSIPSNNGSGAPTIFMIMGLIMGTVVTTIMSIPQIVILKFLRGKAVRSAVS